MVAGSLTGITGMFPAASVHPKDVIFTSVWPMAATPIVAVALLLTGSESTTWRSLMRISLSMTKVWKLGLRRWTVNCSISRKSTLGGRGICSTWMGGSIVQSAGPEAVLVTVIV